MTKKGKFSWLIVLVTVFVLVIACGNKNAQNTETSEVTGATTSGHVASTSTNETDSDAMDDFIKEYEEFVDEYISMVQRMQAGDMTVIVQMQNFQTLYLNWAERLQTLTEEDLTPEFIEKLEEIQNKVEEALSN